MLQLSFSLLFFYFIITLRAFLPFPEVVEWRIYTNWYKKNNACRKVAEVGCAQGVVCARMLCTCNRSIGCVGGAKEKGEKGRLTIKSKKKLWKGRKKNGVGVSQCMQQQWKTREQPLGNATQTTAN